MRAYDPKISWPDGSPVLAGQRITLASRESGNVGIWLVYPDRCETDITYNFVPKGTVATLTGQWCHIGNVWYVHIEVDGAVRRANDVVGDNLWIPLFNAELAPQEK